PEVSVAALNADGGVFENSDLLPFERGDGSSCVEPPIVIPQARPHALRRSQPREHGRGVLRRDKAAAEDALDDEITRNDDEVGRQPVGEPTIRWSFEIPLNGEPTCRSASTATRRPGSSGLQLGMRSLCCCV